jgi:hypothetical protein
MKIAATMIDEVVMSDVTCDGRHVALTLREPCGNLMTLGLPGEELPRLIDHAARALTTRRTQLRRDDDGNGAIAVTWWNLLRDCQTGGFVLSLTFGSGGTLDFALTERMASCMMDTLRCHAPTESAGPRPTRPNQREPHDFHGDT